MITRLLLLVSLLILVAPKPANADLVLVFDDPAGDTFDAFDPGSGPPSIAIDLTRLELQFDHVTGDYDLELTSTAAMPFRGEFRINVLLFNPSAGIDPDPGFFIDNVNDFDLAAPSTTIMLSGTNERLKEWRKNDQVAATEQPFGAPTGFSGFQTQVLVEQFFPDNILALDNFGATVATIGGEGPARGVPEPSSAALVSIAALGLYSRRRRRVS